MAGRTQETSLQVRKNVKPEEFYTLKEELGKGKFGVVFRCEEKTTGKTCAAKFVKTIRAKDREAVQREVELMSKLDHPSLMTLFEAFQTMRQTVMIVECITGGELFERIVDDEFDLTESEVISYMRQICAGVQHMHHNNVLHLDLKPENIMCVNRTGFQLKIIDFGLARKYEPNTDIKVLCGTPEFVAPEVISFDPVGPPTDMWSVGVICYVLLSGLSPFLGDNDNETLNNVTRGEWDFDDEVFDGISGCAKDFILCLLIKESSKRLTVDGCFRHEWLNEISTRTKACETKLSTARLKKFLARRRWQRTANAVRAIGRMNALRLGSQRKSSKSKGGAPSDKSQTSPSSETPQLSHQSDPQPPEPASPTKKLSESSPREESTGPVESAAGENSDPSAAAIQGEVKQESASIDTGIDQDANTTNAVPCSHERAETITNSHTENPSLSLLDQVPGSVGSRELAVSAVDSDIENDSGLDLSLDQNALGKRSTSVSQRSSQDSDGVETRDFLQLVEDNERKPTTSTQEAGDYATRDDTSPSRDKEAPVVNDTNSVTSSSVDKSDISVCSDASEDTTGSSDQGINMERYLFDPSKGVKNQAARWEGRSDSLDRKGTGKGSKDRSRSPPQQAPVFRQKFRHCEVVVGGEARFECRVDGHPTPDIIWYKNGKRVQESERCSMTKTGEDLHALIVKDIGREDQGTYMCEARSPAGKARCSARLAVNHRSTAGSEQVKKSASESKDSTSKQNSTGRKFWQFGSASKAKDQREKSATPEKKAVIPPSTANGKQSVSSLSLDRKGPLRATHTGCSSTSSAAAVAAATNAETTTRKSAVDKLKERAEAFTRHYENKKSERQSLADRSTRRSSNINEYLQRYTRSASADRSSSFSLGSSPSSRRASNTSETDLEPKVRPRLATYATMIRSTQSIGALTAKFEQNQANGSTHKSGASTLPRKDIKYAANLAAKKALFNNTPADTEPATDSPSSNKKVREHVAVSARPSVSVTPSKSTSTLRSKFESSSDSERDSAPFTRASNARVSTGRLSYLDKVEARDSSPSSSFSRSTPTRHSTIGVVKPTSIDLNYNAKHSIKSTASKEPIRPVSTYTSSSSTASSINNQNQPTFISRYETVINSDSESSIASTSSSFSDRKTRSSPSSSISEKASHSSSAFSDRVSRSSASASVSSRYEIRTPASEKAPSFIKKPLKVSATEGESASFSCVVEGEPKPDVNWHFRGKPLTDEGRHEIYEEKGVHYLEIFDLVPKDGGLYTCRIVNSAGRSSALVELVVATKPKRPPFFLQKLSDCEVHEAGASGRLQCRLEGEPAPDISWKKEGKELYETERVHFERNNAKGICALVIDDVNENDDAIYTCVAKNKHGQVSSSAELIVEFELPSKSDVNSFQTDLSLHIDEEDIRPSSLSVDYAEPAAAPSTTTSSSSPSSIPPQFISRPNSVAVDESKSARFKCSLSGSPLPKVTWARGDHVLKDEGRFEIYSERSEFVMEIFDVLPEDSGMYTVTAENSAGKVATGAQLTVHKTTPEKPLIPGPYTANSLSSTDVRSDEVYSASEEAASIISEQIPATAAAAPLTTTRKAQAAVAVKPTPKKTSVGATAAATTPEFQPPSRIPPEFIARPSAQTVVEPNSAKFTCRVVGDPNPSVTWSRNGIVLSDAGRFEIYEEKDEFVLEIFDTTTIDSGVYVCTATNLAGQRTAEALLTIESSAPKGTAPEFVEKMTSSVTVKDGDSAKFVCKLTGMPPPTVHWFYRSQEIVGSDEVYELYHEGETASLCLPEVLPEDEGEYSCVIRNSVGEAKCTATLVVNIEPALSNETMVDSVPDVTPKVSKPEFLQKLKDIQAIDGNPLSLPIRVKGTPEIDVKWYFNNEPIKEDDDFKFVRDGDRYSLVVAEVYPDDAGVYKCKVSNAAGTIECEAKVFVQENDQDGCPPKFLQKPRSVNIDEGSSVTLSCKVDGEPLPTVTWIKEGRPIEAGRRFKIEASGVSGSTRSLNIPTVLATDAGSYNCELRNEHGVERCCVTVVVKPLEEEQTDFRSLLKSRPRLQNISNSPNNVSSDKSDVDQVDFRHVLTRHVTTRKRPEFSIPLGDVEVREGDPATFQCNVDGAPPPAVVWTMNKKEIKESKYFQMSYKGDVAKLLIAEAFPEDEGDYTCTATNAAGESSCTAELTVLDEDQTSDSQKTVTEDLSLTNQLPTAADPTRCVIESDCTHDKVASTFNVRLSKVFNGNDTAPPEAIGGQEANTNNNNNNQIAGLSVSERPEPVQISLSYKQQEHQSAAAAPGAASLKQNRPPSPVEIEPDTLASLSSTSSYASSSSSTATGADKIMDAAEPVPANDEASASVSSSVFSSASLNPSAASPESADASPEPADASPEPDDNAPEAPYFLEPLKDTAVLEESSAMLKCRFAGEPEPDIHWYRDGVELKDDRKITLDFPDDDVAALIVKDTTVEDAGEYTCRAVSSAGTDETTAEIIVEAPARIKEVPRTLQVTAGSDVKVTCNFVARPEPDVVLWNKNRKPVRQDERTVIVDTDTSTTLSIQKATHPDGGRYTLVVENDLGSDEAVIYVSVVDKPDPPVGKPYACHVTRDSLTLSWSGSSYDGGFRISGYRVEMRTESEGWSDDGGVIVPSTSHTFDNLRLETNYIFRVSAQNELGMSEPGQESDPILTVLPEKKTAASRETVKADEDEGECEFRNVTIKPDKEFSENYQIKEVLGKGRFGTVHRCIDKSTGKAYAAKMIKTIKAAEKDAVKNEIDIMNKLHHAKLLQCLDAFESPKQMIMVLEIVNGGELFERVIDDGFDLTESDVIAFMRQICAGVQHMHRQNILHLDLKPENILCIDKTGSRIKLIDFGLARVFDPKTKTKVLFGTPEFVAPEVINYEAIGFTTDMWSVGVVCYILLSGLSPFMGDNDAETLSNVTLAEWDFEDEAFDAISEDAKTFIEDLLIKEKEDRMTADECLEHKWLVTESSEVKKNKISTAKLKNFVARRRWQKTATAVRAIGRMASLSLFGSQKKLQVGDAAAGVAKPPSPSLPTTPETANPPKKYNDVQTKTETKLPASHNDDKSIVPTDDRIKTRDDSTKDSQQNGISKIITNEVTDNNIKDKLGNVEGKKDESDDEDVASEEDEVDGPGKDLNQNIPGAPHFLKEIVDCEVFEGDSARFDCKVVGDPEPDIKWFLDGVEIEETARFIFDCDDDGTYSLIVRRIQDDDEGEYCVKAINSNGEASCVAELLVEGF